MNETTEEDPLLRNLKDAGCIACNQCADTGRCVFRDDLVNVVLDKLDEYDGGWLSILELNSWIYSR